MSVKLDLGKALSQAAQAAGEMAKDASAAVESAAKGATNAAEDAGNVIVDTATSASEAIGSAMCSVAEGMSSAGEQIASSDAGKTIAGAANTVGGIAIGAAVDLAQGASSLASDAASTVEGGINVIKENSFSARLRRARIKGFRDGIKQGAYLAGEKRHNFIYAYVATLCFLMRCDGDFSQEGRSGSRRASITSSWTAASQITSRQRCRPSRMTRVCPSTKSRTAWTTLASCRWTP